MKLGRLLIYVYLVVMPWSVLAVAQISGHDYARVGQLFLMPACAACLVASRAGGLLWPGTAPGRWVAGLMLVQAVLSVSMAERPDWALREVGLALGLVGIAGTTASATSQRELRQGVGAVVLAAAFYGALVLCITGLSLLDHQPLLWREFSLGYNHPRFLNHVQTVALPLLAMATVWSAPRSLLRAAAWFGLTVGFALLWFTGGRATLLAVVLSAIACVALLRGRAHLVVTRLAIGIGLGLLLYLALFLATPALLGLPVSFELGNRAQDSNSVFTRLFLWDLVATQVRQAPLWGAGPMHFAHHQNFDAAHPHNIYLQLAGEWGLPMLLFVLTAARWGLKRLVLAVRHCDSDERSLVGVGLLMSSLAVACDGFLSGNFVMPVSQIWIAALVGWGIAWVRLERGEASLVSPVGRRISADAIAGALLASQVALLTMTSAEIRNLPTFLSEISKEFPSAHSNPRFWSHGWF